MNVHTVFFLSTEDLGFFEMNTCQPCTKWRVHRLEDEEMESFRLGQFCQLSRKIPFSRSDFLRRDVNSWGGNGVSEAMAVDREKYLAKDLKKKPGTRQSVGRGEHFPAPFKTDRLPTLFLLRKENQFFFSIGRISDGKVKAKKVSPPPSPPAWPRGREFIDAGFELKTADLERGVTNVDNLTLIMFLRRLRLRI